MKAEWLKCFEYISLYILVLYIHSFLYISIHYICLQFLFSSSNELILGTSSSYNIFLFTINFWVNKIGRKICLITNNVSIFNILESAHRLMMAIVII